MQPEQTMMGQGLHVWAGASDKRYRYSLYMFGTSFGPGAANYILAKEIKPGLHFPLFIGSTPDLSGLDFASDVRDCIVLGRATHIHIHFNEAGEESRGAECADLVERWNPPCNRNR